MSAGPYIQGTIIRVTFTNTDIDTGLPVDPPDVQATITRPSAISTITYTGGTITKVATGEYRFQIDTSPEPGEWRYEITATGSNAVRRRRAFDVIASPTPIPTVVVLNGGNPFSQFPLGVNGGGP